MDARGLDRGRLPSTRKEFRPLVCLLILGALLNALSLHHKESDSSC